MGVGRGVDVGEWRLGGEVVQNPAKPVAGEPEPEDFHAKVVGTTWCLYTKLDEQKVDAIGQSGSRRPHDTGNWRKCSTD